MIGLIRLSKSNKKSVNFTGFVAKCGFKYLRFNPQITIFPERQVLIYKDKQYFYESNKIYVSFNEDDIERQTMSAIILKNCELYTKTISSGSVYTKTGSRTIVTDSNINLYPIIYRKIYGQAPERFDTFAYSDADFLIFQNEWNSDNSTHRIITSENNSDVDDNELWNQLYFKYPFLVEYFKPFISRQPSNLHNLNVENYQIANVQHFKHFSLQYSNAFKQKLNMQLNNFSTMDVVDLTNLSEIKIDNPQKLSTYPMIEILKNDLNFLGEGLNLTYCKRLENNHQKFYYLIITDSYYHKIENKNRAILKIQTNPNKTRFSNNREILPELIFLKFNRNCLENYLDNIIIENIRN